MTTAPDAAEWPRLGGCKPHIETDVSAINAVLVALTEAGYLAPRIEMDPRSEGWTLRNRLASEGYVHHDGRLYVAVETDGMVSVYQEMYRRIFAEHLTMWGIAEDQGVGLLHSGSLILFWGPVSTMRTKRPAALALDRVRAADESWIRRLEGRWRDAAAEFEEHLEKLWGDVTRGFAEPLRLRAAVSAKVALSSFGVDAVIVPEEHIERWVAQHLPGDLVADVVKASCLPNTGHLAFDTFEAECWRLARSFDPAVGVPDAARRRFIQEGLFFIYETLDNTRRDYFFERYPLEVASRYADAVRSSEDALRRLGEIGQRAWRRRYHRDWAWETINAHVADVQERRRLLALHMLLGTARDFDEEKRRVNMKFWRCLFAIADGLGISLSDAGTDLDRLCAALDRRSGCISLDPTFIPENTEVVSR